MEPHPVVERHPPRQFNSTLRSALKFSFCKSSLLFRLEPNSRVQLLSSRVTPNDSQIHRYQLWRGDFDEWPTRAGQKRCFWVARLRTNARRVFLRKPWRGAEWIRIESNRPAGSGGGGGVCQWRRR